MSNQNVRIYVRPLPHREFVQGWPGVPASPNGKRPGAHVAGTVEIRPKPKGIKASWVRIELKKIEQVPGNKTTSRFKELIGSGPKLLWQSQANKFKVKGGSQQDGYEVLQSKDFDFTLPIPDGLPPSVLLDRDKNLGIFYELVVSIMAKPKSGIFGSTPKKGNLIVESVPLTLEKHDLHASWPVYSYQAKIEDRQVEGVGLNMRVKRDVTCYGPGDTITLQVQIKSNRIDPVKLSRFEITLREVLTYRGDLNKGPDSIPGDQQITNVIENRVEVQKSLYKDEPYKFELKSTLHAHHARMTISTAKHIMVAYNLRVRAVIDKERQTTADVRNLVIDHMPSTIGTWVRKQGAIVLDKILAGAGSLPPALDDPSNPSEPGSTLGDTEESRSRAGNPAPSSVGSGSFAGVGAGKGVPFHLVQHNGRSPGANYNSPYPPPVAHGMSVRDSKVPPQNYAPPSNRNTQVFYGQDFRPGPNDTKRISSAPMNGPPSVASFHSQSDLGQRSQSVRGRESARYPLEDGRSDSDRWRKSSGPQSIDPQNFSEQRLGSQRQSSRLVDAAKSRIAKSRENSLERREASRRMDGGTWESAEAEKARLHTEATQARDSFIFQEQPSTTSSATPYISADLEKRRLYEELQSHNQDSELESKTVPQQAASSGAIPYMSADLEKRRLYEELQAQNHEDGADPSRTALVPQNSDTKPQDSEKAAVQAYHNAREQHEQWLTRSSPGGGSTPHLPTSSSPEPSSSNASKTLTAEEEKAALAARYESEQANSGGSSSIPLNPRRASGFGFEKHLYETAVKARNTAQADLRRSMSQTSTTSNQSPPLSQLSISQQYFAEPDRNANELSEIIDSPHQNSVNHDLPGYDSSSGPQRGMFSEKEALARYHANREQNAQHYISRTESPTEAHGTENDESLTEDSHETSEQYHQLNRHTSLSQSTSSDAPTVESSESSYYLHRDPTIAQGKKRAVSLSPSVVSSNSFTSYDNRSPTTLQKEFYGFNLSPLEELPSTNSNAPPRPPKTPMFS